MFNRFDFEIDGDDMRIGFFPNMGKETIIEVLHEAYTYCQAEGIEVFWPEDEVTDALRQAIGMDDVYIMPRPQIYQQIDLAFSFGGDGTLIQLARNIIEYEVPICGINLGELGFLNQIELKDMERRIKQIGKGDYRVENRVHLRAYVVDKDGEQRPLAPIINELVVTRVEPGKMARIQLAINEGYTQTYPSDGLIVSCSTGSTGYNLSAGGPIMAPDNKSIIVTPIAPHLLQGVSLVLKESARIDITMPERQKALHINIDGNFDYTFTYGERLHIAASPMYCQYVRFYDQKFFATLFTKLAARREGDQ